MPSRQHHKFKAGDLVKLNADATATLGWGPHREALLGVLLIVKKSDAQKYNSPSSEGGPSKSFQCISPVSICQQFILYDDELTLLE